ncbi:methylenetetrahydrofolate reductase [Anoxynatronum sibiricum]|uniref:Methylenetetrahydrofolate reductase n=2 Tax=Anoxynatronum sibiricum TaxID=210623 RepID=A0ABU9VTG0_9CLOT
MTEARPFPFMKTLDPQEYSQKYLTDLAIPHIIYRCVGKYPPEVLEQWIGGKGTDTRYSVFVGAASSSQAVSMSLAQAYQLVSKNDAFLMGGVAIPERHLLKADEHLRVISKQQKGCSYFVTQAVYNVEASKNFLSDYYYHCRREGLPLMPVVLTLTPCGSLKTLAFMKWLGVNIPRWLENELCHSSDILDRSIHLSRQAFVELQEFGREKGIPIGCNVESVSVNRVEIEASIQLARDIKQIMNR